MTDIRYAQEQLRWPQVPQAQGMLAALLGVPIDQAALGLELLAQFRGVSLQQAAGAMLDKQGTSADQPVESLFPELAVLRQHLDGDSSPLDDVG